ncbi:MAG: succinyl-diaminopimelate desuccinylase [uncultured bacterium (gcode 4)]|uniref:Succinyl-diaminopimelate desuccinylase n=1 Tax=uncultured bacterium (gcode 4) TaxID=1234023 RepID=K2FTY1_9BACT|nr:MAG: succinyl-diaminopimelate desuccinylase [uncultured bacterium (gcode 4)]
MKIEQLLIKQISIAQVSDEINWENLELENLINETWWRIEKMVFTTNPRNWNEIPHYLLRIWRSWKHIWFVSHWDVVSYWEWWETIPNEWTEKDGFIYWRWACDMLWWVAAQILAWKEIAEAWKMLSIFLPWDEETESDWIQELIKANDVPLDYIIWWEPTSNIIAWDAIKIWRRGRVHWEIIFEWAQFHTAYINSQNWINLTKLLVEWFFKEIIWSYDNWVGKMPATSFAIRNIRMDDLWWNTVPWKIILSFDARISSVWWQETFKLELEKRLDKLKINYDLILWRWTDPYFTEDSDFINKISKSIEKVNWVIPEINCEWWTSDCRFFWKIWIPTIEVWLENSTIHKPNERQSIENLERLKNIYIQIWKDL